MARKMGGLAGLEAGRWAGRAVWTDLEIFEQKIGPFRRTTAIYRGYIRNLVVIFSDHSVRNAAA